MQKKKIYMIFSFEEKFSIDEFWTISIFCVYGTTISRDYNGILFYEDLYNIQKLYTREGYIIPWLKENGLIDRQWRKTPTKQNI